MSIQPLNIFQNAECSGYHNHYHKAHQDLQQVYVEDVRSQLSCLPAKDQRRQGAPRQDQDHHRLRQQADQRLLVGDQAGISFS